jgi:TonB family protein
MSRRFTLLALTIAIISGASKFASAQLKDKPLSGERKALAIFAPRPRYPYEARDKHLAGSGVVLVNVDSPTGYVTSARMLKSTGHQILDEAALEAFRQWRFRPGTVAKVRIPIHYTMRGARY